MPQPFTAENARIISISPLRQWLIAQLDQLLCPGGGQGPEIRIDTHSALFTALTGLTQKSYDDAASTMTCCTSFVARVYAQARQAGGVPVVPKGQPVDDKTALKYMPTFRMGDLGGDGPSSALRKAGCITPGRKTPAAARSPATSITSGMRKVMTNTLASSANTCAAASMKPTMAGSAM